MRVNHVMNWSEPSSIEATERIGRYEVQSTLATTGTASILLARDVEGGELVVLKRFDPGHRSGYLREVAAGLNIVHPNIAAPRDTFYSADGSGCLVYEYFQAGTLRKLIRKGEPASLATVIDCARDCLQGLVYLHRHRLIHCDIKPENIFLREQTGRTVFVLGDLGSTCPLREAVEGRHRTGSPAYAAPERMVDRFAFNSDLYSLGVVLFELAAGELPFSGGPREVARAHAHEPVPLQLVGTAFLRDFIAALLEKDPGRRVANAERALMLLSAPEDRPVQDLPRPRPVSAPVGSPRPVSSLQPSPLGKQLVLGRRPLRHVASNLVESGFQRLFVVSGPDGPLLLLETETDFTISSPHPGTKPRMIPKNGAIRIRGTSELIYCVGNRLCAYNLLSETRTVLHEGLSGVIGFCCDETRLLWRTRRSVHVMDLRSREEISFPLPHYLLDAQALLLPDGHFSVSTGPMNNEISLRNAKGEELRRIPLDGPIFDMTSERTVQLVLTLNVKDKDSYAIWRAAEFADPQRLALPEDSRAVATTPGHAFWVTSGTQVFQCGIGLAPRPVFSSETRIDGVSVSPDHHWLLVWEQLRTDAVRASIYSNINETPKQGVPT
jgi:serine/threonine protein kinase